MGKAAGFGGAERADDNVNVRAPGAVFSYGDFSDAERDRAGGRGAEQRGAEGSRGEQRGAEGSRGWWTRCRAECLRVAAMRKGEDTGRCGRTEAEYLR